MYFADARLDYIEFVNYDGSGRTAVVQDDHVRFIFIVIKFMQHERVVRIEMVDWQYVDSRILLQFVRHPHALTLFEDTVYWSDRRENRVSQCNKFNCDNQTVVRSRVWGPLGITVVHPARQPQGLYSLYSISLINGKHCSKI